jgi:hypothetical protein
MTPSSSPSAGRWSISTVPSCVYPSSMCCTFARVHGWAQGDSPEAPTVRSGALCDEPQPWASRNPSQVDGSRRSAGAAVSHPPGEPPVSAGPYPGCLVVAGFAIFLALSQSSKCRGSVNRKLASRLCVNTWPAGKKLFRDITPAPRHPSNRRMHLGGVGRPVGPASGRIAPTRGAILPCCSSPVLGVEAVGGTDTRHFLDSPA